MHIKKSLMLDGGGFEDSASSSSDHDKNEKHNHVRTECFLSSVSTPVQGIRLIWTVSSKKLLSIGRGKAGGKSKSNIPWSWILPFTSGAHNVKSCSNTLPIPFSASCKGKAAIYSSLSWECSGPRVSSRGPNSLVIKFLVASNPCLRKLFFYR